MLEPYTLDSMFTVGGVPEGITALQRLQHLRLGNVTEPLAGGISQMMQLTQLTSLDLLQDHPAIFDLEISQVRCTRVVV